MQTNRKTKLAKRNTKEMKERIIPSGRVNFILPYMGPGLFHMLLGPHCLLSYSFPSILHEPLSVMDAAASLSVSVFSSTEIDILMLYFVMWLPATETKF